METKDPIVGVVLTVVHFTVVLVAVVVFAVKGVVYESIFVLVALTLAMADVSLLPYWTNELTPSSPAWTVAGAWGFILVNYLLVLYAAYALDAYVGAEQDLLGRALSRTAGKVLRDAKRKADKEEESAVVNPIAEEPVERDPEALTLGGAMQSSWARANSDSSLSSHASEREAIRTAHGASRGQVGDSGVSISSFEILARVLPRMIFVPNDPVAKAAAAVGFDEATTNLIGMGTDLTQYIQQYKRRMAVKASVFYALSILVLVGMAALEQVTTQGKVIGWFDVGWIALGDSIVLVSALPKLKARSKSQPGPVNGHGASDRRNDRDSGWISLIPKHTGSPPLWILLLLLLLCRLVLTIVPLWLNFVAQCITYVICATYLGYVIIVEKFSGEKKLPKIPLALLCLFTLWLTLDTTLIGLSNISRSVAAYMGESRKFHWDVNSPALNEWVFGPASISFVASLLLVFVAHRVASKSRGWVWLFVYILLCLTGFTLDCIARGGVSIELGIFVSAVFLAPSFFLVGLAFRRTISAIPPNPSLLLILAASLALDIGWALTLDRVNSDSVSFFVIVAAIEFHSFVCFLNVLALVYNCVMNRVGWSVGIMSLGCYIAIIPIAFSLASDSDPYDDDYLAVSIISVFVLPALELFALCSTHFADVGWENAFPRPSNILKQARLVHLWRLGFVLFIVFLSLSVVFTIIYFSVISAIWLGTALIVIFFFTTCVQAQLFEKSFTQREMHLRFVILCSLAFLFFALAIVDSEKHFLQRGRIEEGAFYLWTHFLIAGFVLFTFALLDFAIAIFHSLPTQILSPSSDLFGVPLVRYSIERKGGEIFVHNLHILTCLACFIVLDAIGFIVAFAGASKPWGTVLSSAAFCLTSLLGFHLGRVRSHGFRSDLAQVNLTSELAEDAFVQVLKDTVHKIRQFSTRTVIFDSHLALERLFCSQMLTMRLKREEKEKSLAFFFCLFNLALKRKMRLANEHECLLLQRKRLRRQRRRLARAMRQNDVEAGVANAGNLSSGNPASAILLDAAKPETSARVMEKTNTHADSSGQSTAMSGASSLMQSRNSDAEPSNAAATIGTESVIELDLQQIVGDSRRSADELIAALLERERSASQHRLEEKLEEASSDDDDDSSSDETDEDDEEDSSNNNEASQNSISQFGNQDDARTSSHSLIDPNKNELFIDTDFPNHPELIICEWDTDMAEIIGNEYDELYLWLRPSQIASTENKPWGLRNPLEDRMVQDVIRVDPRDVQQGNIGDCWLLSALSVVALKQRLFDKVLPHQRKNEKGRYTVRLFDFVQGEWVNLELDDCLPCDPDTRMPLYATSKCGQIFWVCLLEKAFAKRQGGYPRLNDGQVHRALVDLTGGFSQLFSFDEDFELVESGALWTTVLSLARAGHLLVLGSRSNVEEFGLVKDHAYAVMSVVEVNDSRGRHRLLQLQDPWGRTSWKGHWSDSDRKRWSPRARWMAETNSELVVLQGEEAEYINGESEANKEGTFWMDFDDAAMLFKWLFACRVFAEDQGWIHHDVVSEWSDQTAGGPPHLAMTQRNPQFLLSFPSKVDANGKRNAVVFISICNIEEKETYPYMSLLLLHLNGQKAVGPILSSQVVASTGKYKDARELSIEVALPLDKRFTLLPSLSSPKELGKFRLSCHAKVPFSLEPL